MSISLDYSKIYSNLKSKWIWILLIPAWIALGFFVSQIVLGLIFIFFGDFLQSIFSETLISLIAEALIYSMMIFFTMVVPWVINKRNKISKNTIGLSRLPIWRELVISPVAFVLYMTLTILLTGIMMQLCPWIDFDQAQDTGFSNLSIGYEYVVAFLALVVIAPFAEEIIFRGYLFSKLKKYAPVWLAIIVTSLTFGAAHMAWNVAIDTFALSVVACVLREMFGTIWPSILIHMIKNGLAYYILFINPDLLSKLVG